MTAEMFALAAIAVVILLVWAADRLDALEASKAAHMRDALSVSRDPAKTAGGVAGKSYTGGFGIDAYYIRTDEYDRHTLDAIYRNEQGEQPTQAERLP